MFKLQYHDKLCYLSSGLLSSQDGVSHLFSTRISGEEQQLNLGLSCGEYKDVLHAFTLACNIIHADYHRLVLTQQVHSDKIIAVHQTDAGNGLLYENCFGGVDGFITNETNLPISIFYADCVPLIFYDPKKRVIGACHAGWRGTVLKIAAKTVRKMAAEYGSNLNDIIAAIGPCIGPCHFETSLDVYQEFEKNFPKHINLLLNCQKKDKYYIDLKLANQLQLIDIGINKAHIDVCMDCTVCRNELYFSHRAENGKTGRMAAIIMLKEEGAI